MKKVMISLLTAITVVGMSVPALAGDISAEKSETQIMDEPILISTNNINNTNNNVIINGKNITLDASKVVVKNGNVMVPLKSTAEALGFKVNISKDNNKANLDNDEIKTEIKVGVDSYYYTSSKEIGMTAPEQLEAAPIVIDDNIYVPIKIYNLLFNDSKAIGSFWCQTKDGQLIYVDNGDLYKGWKLINNKWYFMNSNGIMQKGWVQSNGNWYYLLDNGEMATNTTTPDGYKVDQNGQWDLGKPVSISNIKTTSINTIENPIEEFKTIEEAQKVLKFKINVPKQISTKFSEKYISTISRELFQICYNNGGNDILFRMGQNIDKVSGDYNEYKINDTIKIDGKDVELSGDGNLIELATWKINDMSYSLSISNGMKKDDIINIIKDTF